MNSDAFAWAGLAFAMVALVMAIRLWRVIR